LEGYDSAAEQKELEKYPGFVYQDLASIGVWTVGGENWDDNVEKICDELTEEHCEWARD